MSQSKYKQVFCEQLITHMSEGLSYESFCGVIGVARSVIYDWERQHPEWKESKAVAFDHCQLFWERIGINQATGDCRGSSASWIFSMKNRFKWTDRQEVITEERKPELIIEFTDKE